VLNFSPEKLFLLGILALVVLGPHRLPQAARTLGRLVAEARRVSGSFQTEVREALTEPRDALSHAVGDLGLTDLRSSVRDTVTEAVNPFKGGFLPPATTALGAGSPGGTLGAPAASPSPPPVPDDPALN
jgi:sec-independent protein translocase protein TatB